MWKDYPLFPDSASTFATEVDALFFFTMGVCVFFGGLVASLVLFFSIRYRRRKGVAATQIEGSLPLEILWSAVPLVPAMVIFFWGADVYLETRRPPQEALDVYITGKQWMWRAQHPDGRREINDLHVPVGTPVRLTMASEDVIHSFYVPAFRIKTDVLPGRYTTAWFEATKTGVFDLFCAEYCGAKHSHMVGKIYVMEPAEYQAWLRGASADESPVQTGERLFGEMRCDTCHKEGSGARGPSLAGRFGELVALEGGGTAKLDPSYIRESILQPSAKISMGYRPIMPTYQGQLSEDEILSLVAYLESLGGKDGQ